jgi:hypothetical protein
MCVYADDTNFRFAHQQSGDLLSVRIHLPLDGDAGIRRQGHAGVNCATLCGRSIVLVLHVVHAHHGTVAKVRVLSCALYTRVCVYRYTVTALHNRIMPTPVIQDRMRLKRQRAEDAKRLQSKSAKTSWHVRWMAKEKSVRIAPDPTIGDGKSTGVDTHTMLA